MKRDGIKETLIGLGILAAMCALLVLAGYLLFHRASSHEEMSNMYCGTLQDGATTYEVIIDEVWCSSGYANRVVHLHPANEPSYREITGHQDQCRTNGWDRIFLLGDKRPDGLRGPCRMVVPKGSDWVVEPCDEEKVQYVKEAEIFNILSLLDRAMADFHNTDHLVSGYRWNEKEQRCEPLKLKKT